MAKPVENSSAVKAAKFDFTPALKGAAAAIVAVALVMLIYTSPFMPTAAVVLNTPSEDAVSAKVIEYINVNFLSSQGLAAKLTKSEAASDSLYTVYFDVMKDSQKTNEGYVYVSKDGKTMVLGAIGQTIFDLDTPIPQPPTDAGTDAGSDTIAKTDKPNVKMFVMSFCPYGQQAEAGLFPVYGLLGDAIEFEPHFVVYGKSMYAGSEASYCLGEYCSMHGIGELNEDVRQLCVFKYARDKFVDYVNSINSKCTFTDVDTCWEGVAADANIDVAAIKSCAESEAEGLLAAEKALNDKYGVQGSPVVIINETKYPGGRSPEEYKGAICDAFNTAPDECTVALSSTADSTSGGCGS